MKITEAIIKNLDLLHHKITLVKSDHFDLRKCDRKLNIDIIVSYIEQSINLLLSGFISNNKERTYGIIKVNKLNIVVAVETSRNGECIDCVLITAKEKKTFYAKNPKDLIITL